MAKQRRKEGALMQIDLLGGTYVFARTLEETQAAFYENGLNMMNQSIYHKFMIQRYCLLHLL